MKKILFAILDGAADIPCPELGGRTPLEAAKTPNMDALAQSGVTGMMYPIAKGFAPESDSAAISLLGYDVLNSYTGRGPLEALGAGLKIQEGDLAFRVNFATINDNNVIVDRRVCRDLSNEEASQLADAINTEITLTKYPSELRLKNFRGFRGVLLIHRLDGGQFSGNISNVDPGYIKRGAFSIGNPKMDLHLKPCIPLDNTQEAAEAAEITNEFIARSRDVLGEHPVNSARIRRGQQKANIILTRDAGDRLPKFQNINERYNARFGMFAEMPCEVGIGTLMGMKIIEHKSRSRSPKENYRRLAHLIAEELRKLDIIYLHLKGPDNPGHDGDAEGKKESIEMIDCYFFGTLLPLLENTLLVVTSDHATPCHLRTHSSDPVPLLISGGEISGGEITRDKVVSFGERACRTGSLGLINGRKLMPISLHLAGQS